ncbi:unnamed protein product [Brassica rapa]|uniref:Uncharacterized protein n=1 Tax=Brassica campestris TaxID=3711 RepID=A0A8D9M812_BRACM|nr:unnamed protein product [Brassica rapa]
MTKTWKVLAWQFTQLNSAMGNAPSQLKTADTPNSAALRTDKVEEIICFKKVECFFVIFSRLKHKEKKWSAGLMQEMMNPASNGALEVIESNKSENAKVLGRV